MTRHSVQKPIPRHPLTWIRVGLITRNVSYLLSALSSWFRLVTVKDVPRGQKPLVAIK